MMTFEGIYEFAKNTQRMVRLVHMTTAIRRSPCPYLYVSKELYKEMGGVVPPNGQLPNPKDAIRITIRRVDSE